MNNVNCPVCHKVYSTDLFKNQCPYCYYTTEEESPPENLKIDPKELKKKDEEFSFDLNVPNKIQSSHESLFQINETMVCIKCGAKNTITAFCKECGYPLSYNKFLTTVQRDELICEQVHIDYHNQFFRVGIQLVMGVLLDILKPKICSMIHHNNCGQEIMLDNDVCPKCGSSHNQYQCSACKNLISLNEDQCSRCNNPSYTYLIRETINRNVSGKESINIAKKLQKMFPTFSLYKNTFIVLLKHEDIHRFQLSLSNIAKTVASYLSIFSDNLVYLLNLGEKKESNEFSDILNSYPKGNEGQLDSLMDSFASIKDPEPSQQLQSQISIIQGGMDQKNVTGGLKDILSQQNSKLGITGQSALPQSTPIIPQNSPLPNVSTKKSQKVASSILPPNPTKKTRRSKVTVPTIESEENEELDDEKSEEESEESENTEENAKDSKPFWKGLQGI